MNRQDEECCLKVAELWKETGGDAEGFFVLLAAHSGNVAGYGG